MTTYVFAASNSTAADKTAADYEWPATGPTPAMRSLFSSGNATFEFRPGTYQYEGPGNILKFGSNSVVKGSATIPIPANKRTFIAPDPAKFAVFSSIRVEPEATQAGTAYQAVIEIVPGASNVTFQDLYLAGYTLFRCSGMKNGTFRRCVVHNYHGTYPNGSWANMGYSNATGAFWLTGGANTVTFTQCVAQYSFHHGFLIHTGNVGTWFKNIEYKDCRALTCGCGLLKGESASDLAKAEQLIPQRKGRGFRDWSTGFDLCEKGSIENVLAEDCYAYDCWKVGFYTEPWKTLEPTQHWNLRLVRCVSDDAGQRAGIRLAGDTRDSTIPRETEGSNFYVHQATLTDCVSRNGWKAGYYFDPEGRLVPAARASQTRVLCSGCIDCGSRYGFVSEANAAGYVTLENCKSLNNSARALRLYGNGGPYIVKNITIKTTNPTKAPVLLGTMCRLQYAWSRDPGRISDMTNKYMPYTITMTGLVMSGTVEGLQAGTYPVEIRQGSKVNGASRGATTITNVSLTTATTAADAAICAGATTPGTTEPQTPVDVPVEAAFTATPTAGPEPLVVRFTDQSAGDPIAWSWSFGDGASSGEQNPPHTYTTPGTYAVTLVVKNEDGETSTCTKPAFVTVSQGPTVPTPSPRYAVSLVRTEESRDDDGALVLTAVLRIDEGAA
jgi:PKD repeat protein